MYIKSLILTGMLFFAGVSQGQTPDMAGLRTDKKISVLNDKAFFRFPSKAVNTPREADIMAADPNVNKETRVIFDTGSMRLVFFAQELFATNNENLVAVAAKEGSSAFRNRVLTDKDSILSVLTTPIKIDSTGNGILVNSLLVRVADHSVFRISAFINPAAYKYAAQFQALSERVFATVSKGSRRLNISARTESFRILDGNKHFQIQLPEGYIVTKDKKYDFEVLKFQRVRDMTDASWASLTIYTGAYPSYFYSDYNLDESKAEKVKGQFARKQVEWLYFKDPVKQAFLKEQKIPADDVANGLVIHIAMQGSDPEAIDGLTKIIEAIKITD